MIFRSFFFERKKRELFIVIILSKFWYEHPDPTHHTMIKNYIYVVFNACDFVGYKIPVEWRII